MIDGEQQGDGGVVSRRRGRHAAPAVGGGASAHGLRARVIAATVVAVAVFGGALAATYFAGAPQAVDETANVASTARPTSTDPAAPSSYAPLLPSPGLPPSPSATNPASPREDLAHPPTEMPTDSAAEPPPIAESGRDTPPAEMNRPDATNPPDETMTPEDQKGPEDCVERRGFLELMLLGPSCP